MTSPTKIYHLIQIILQMCPCDQRLVTLVFLWQKLSQPQFCKDLTRKNTFFLGWSWLKFNDLGLALGTNLKFYTTVAKRLKLKVRMFWGLSPRFVEVTGEKLVGESFCHLLPPSWIGLIRINIIIPKHFLYLVYVRPCLDVVYVRLCLDEDLFMTYLCDLFFFFALIIINQIISLK